MAACYAPLRAEVTFTRLKRDRNALKLLYKTQKWPCHWLQVSKQGEFRNMQQFISKFHFDERRILHSSEGCCIRLGNRRSENAAELLGSYSLETLWTSNTSAIRSGCLWDKSSFLFILFQLLKHIWMVQFIAKRSARTEPCLLSYLRVFRYILG